MRGALTGHRLKPSGGAGGGSLPRKGLGPQAHARGGVRRPRPALLAPMHFAHEFLSSLDPFGVLLRDDFAPYFVDSGAIGHLNEPDAHEVAASDGDAGKFGDPGIGIERYEHIQRADRFK